jgi:hypothetical protein
VPPQAIDRIRRERVGTLDGPMGVGEVASQLIITNSGQSFDRLRRTAAGWRIAHRDCTLLLMMSALPDDEEIPQ